MRRWQFKLPASLSATKSSGAALARRQYGVKSLNAAAKEGQKGKREPQNRIDSLRGGGKKAKQSQLPTRSPVEWPPQQHDDARTTRTRHLLRALLRECTYLPDPHARAWTTQHIVTRFRTYAFKTWKQEKSSEQHSNSHHPEEQSSHDGVDWESRLRAKEKEGRSWLAYLQRANQGERKCLLRLLLMTYGRIGKRRHELMKPLLAGLPEEIEEKMMMNTLRSAEEEVADLIVDDTPSRKRQATESAATASNTTSPTMTLLPNPKLTPQLHTLLTSQISQPPPDLTRPNPRRLTLESPALNTWLRPMPQCRVRNKQKAHRASLLNRTLPPLPADEFKHLLALASGKEPVPALPPRRVPAKSSNATTSNTMLESVVAYGKLPTHRVRENREGHAITPRFMRRLYADVVRQCAVMEGEKSGWNVVWGGKAMEEMKFAAVGDGGG